MFFDDEAGLEPASTFCSVIDPSTGQKEQKWSSY
jgi:hypothetical protein